MELKPCPFCGCKQILIRPEREGFKLSCSQCHVFMIRLAKPAKPAEPAEPEPYYSPHDSKAQAYQNLLDRWNRRTPIAETNPAPGDKIRK